MIRRTYIKHLTVKDATVIELSQIIHKQCQIDIQQ